MAHTNQMSAPHGILAGSRPFFQQIRIRLAEAIARRRVYNQIVGELDGLSQRDLAEMGIARNQIHRIAKEHAYGQ